MAIYYKENTFTFKSESVLTFFTKKIYLPRFKTAEMMQNMKNTVISAETIVEPTGVSANIEIIMPKNAQIRDITTEQIITLRKLLKTLIAESAGKIMRADISSEPTKFIAITMITAITTAMSRLYISDRIPVALAKLSSKVTANILL